MTPPEAFRPDRRSGVSTRRSRPRRLMPFGAVAPSGQLRAPGQAAAHAELVDLSEGGLCLMLSTPMALAQGDRVELTLHENFGVGSLQVALEVRWLQANPMGQKVGLRFCDPGFCPSNTFLKRYLDTTFFSSDRRSASSRRSSPRRLLPTGPEGVHGQLTREAGGSAPVDLLDLSKGGACVSLNAALPIRSGERVSLHLRDNISGATLDLAAEVRWLQPTPTGLSFGLRFLEPGFSPARTFLGRYLGGPIRPEPTGPSAAGAPPPGPAPPPPAPPPPPPAPPSA